FERIEPVRFGRRITLDTGIDQTMRIGGFSPGLPQLLGVRPQIARSFAEEDAADPAVLVLSDAYWARAFGRDPAVIGRTLRFHGRSYTVIGVMPAKFRHFAGATSDAWLPIDDAAASDVAARLRPGLSIAQAQRQLNEAVAPSS